MILMLDDEPHFVAAYKEVLEFEGFEVLLSQDEDEFFTILSSAVPEAVVIDIMLSSGDDAGLHIYNRFRNMFTDMPAILLTNREDVKAGSDIDKYTKILCKRDVTPMNLVDNINSLLSKRY